MLSTAPRQIRRTASGSAHGCLTDSPIAGGGNGVQPEADRRLPSGRETEGRAGSADGGWPAGRRGRQIAGGAGVIRETDETGKERNGGCHTTTAVQLPFPIRVYLNPPVPHEETKRTHLTTAGNNANQRSKGASHPQACGWQREGTERLPAQNITSRVYWCHRRHTSSSTGRFHRFLRRSHCAERLLKKHDKSKRDRKSNPVS